MRHRFHALCSYFAMFPEAFAEKWVEQLTKRGDTVLDPFCGRGTLPFQALLMGRNAVGCDTNLVAYCVSRAKTNAPPLGRVMRRLGELEASYRPTKGVEKAIDALPMFFRHAYHPSTLGQIVHLREQLDFKGTATDCMISALALGSLHGETDRSARFLSNQMPHTISTKPGYSVRFWKERRLKAPNRNAFELLRQQAFFRYESGRPKEKGTVFHMDMRDLPRRTLGSKPIRCVVTSPPYFDVTNYAEDQWLRLWFLKGPAQPTGTARSSDDRHSSLDRYWELIADMWRALGLVLGKNSDIVIRLGATRIGPERLVNSLEGVARASRRRVTLVSQEVSTIVRRQTDAFRPGSTGCKVEVDCHFRMI